MAFSISYTYQLLDKFSPALQKINRTQQRFNSTIKKSRASMKNFSDRLTNVQSAIAGVGGALIGYQILATFNQFETAMNKLSAVSMGTQDQLQRFRETALQLGAITKFTAAEVTEGMIFLKMAGLSMAEVLEAIPGMLNLAAAGGIDLAAASDLATNVLLQQGLAIDQLGRASDNLATIQTTTNTTILEAGEAMKNTLTTAAALGFKLEETTALIGALANVGYKAGDSGTIMRNALVRLAAATPKADKMLRRLGINVKKLMPKGELGLENFLKIIDQLVKKKAGVRELYTIFQERGGKAMLALMSVGTKTIRQLVRMQEEGVKLGTSSDMATRQMAGLPGMILSLKSALEALQIAVVEIGLAGILTNIGKSFTKMIRTLTISHPDLLNFIGLFMAIGIAVIGVTAAIVILSPVIGALLNPIGAVILAVGTLISFWAAFYKKNEKLQEAFSIVKEALAPLGQLMRSFFGIFSESDISLIDLTATAILGLAKAFGFLMKGVNWMIKPFIGESVIKAQEQLMKQKTETTLNGEIKVSAAEGTQVEKATMEICSTWQSWF
jgi:TP901 family phage tail tape measure protein